MIQAIKELAARKELSQALSGGAAHRLAIERAKNCEHCGKPIRWYENANNIDSGLGIRVHTYCMAGYARALYKTLYLLADEMIKSAR